MRNFKYFIFFLSVLLFGIITVNADNQTFKCEYDNGDGNKGSVEFQWGNENTVAWNLNVQYNSEKTSNFKTENGKIANSSIVDNYISNNKCPNALLFFKAKGFLASDEYVVFGNGSNDFSPYFEKIKSADHDNNDVYGVIKLKNDKQTELNNFGLLLGNALKEANAFIDDKDYKPNPKKGYVKTCSQRNNNIINSFNNVEKAYNRLVNIKILAPSDDLYKKYNGEYKKAVENAKYDSPLEEEYPDDDSNDDTEDLSPVPGDDELANPDDPYGDDADKKYHTTTDRDNNVDLSGCIIDKGTQSIIDWIMNLVRIGGVILLVVLGMLDFVKAAASGEQEEMKKSKSKFVKRLIACVVLFFVPIIVDILVGLVNLGSGENCNSNDSNDKTDDSNNRVSYQCSCKYYRSNVDEPNISDVSLSFDVTNKDNFDSHTINYNGKNVTVKINSPQKNATSSTDMLCPKKCSFDESKKVLTCSSKDNDETFQNNNPHFYQAADENGKLLENCKILSN